MVKNLFRAIEPFLKAESPRIGGLAALVGLASGAGIWLFKVAIEGLRQVLFGSVSGGWVLLIPVLGGLVVGWLAQRAFQGEKLHGTASIMQAIALAGGRLNYRQAPLKSLAAILSIGSGASIGPEDPSVQIGANLGSLVGQALQVSEERLRSLVAAGAASAIAAAFNAPIAGVFFSLEILLGEINSSNLGMVLVAAVVSSVFTQAVAGASPAFPIPAYTFNSAWEFPLYLVLGLAGGLLSALYATLLYRFQDLFHNWQIAQPLKTATAGLIVGAVGYFLPQLFGVGYETIGEVLRGAQLGIGFLLVLMFGKTLLTPLSIGGGFVGGVFAPALFIGAMLGSAFGLLCASLFPSLNIQPPAFALVGMAAVLAGAVHAPLTAILLLFEMTHDYRIILPLMFSVAVSLIVAQHLQKDSIYSKGLARVGIRLDRGRDIDVLSTLTVGEVMRTEVQTLTESMSLDEAAEVFARTRRHGLPVLDAQGKLCGVLTLQDLDRAQEQHKKTVGEACTRQIEVAFPDEPLSAALQRMSRRDIGRIPVVSRQDARQLVGILRRADVIHAYQVALVRRASQRHRQAAIRLDAFTPPSVAIWEMEVEPNCLADGKRLSEIPFPEGCMVASVRRGDKVFVPRGSTLLSAGDRLVIVNDKQSQEIAQDQILELLRKRNGS
ncbi:MAG: chloride channel protein [Anaerolineae bacterium]|jgi:CIC family chloride channel protein|nr:MAG: chloride channel protein [Anaerolineae bacterium]